MRKLLSVLLFIFSGFLVYSAQLVSFVTLDARWLKAGFVAVFVAVAAALASAAICIGRTTHPRRALGITLAAASGVTLLVIFSLLILLLEPKLLELAQGPGGRPFKQSLAGLSDYVFGGVSLAASIAGSLWLIISSGKGPQA